MLPALAMSIVMGIVVGAVAILNLPVIVTLILQVVIGIVVYISESVAFKTDSFSYILSIVKPYSKKVFKR